MRQMNTKGWLATVGMIILAGTATADDQDARIGEVQMTEQASPFNLYIVPRSSMDAITAFSEIMTGCIECYQVERFETIVGGTGFQFPRNDCYLHVDLVELSKQLNVAIEKVHSTQGWNLEELRNGEPKGCDRKILGFRIDVALQIIDRSLQ